MSHSVVIQRLTGQCTDERKGALSQLLTSTVGVCVPNMQHAEDIRRVRNNILLSKHCLGTRSQKTTLYHSNHLHGANTALLHRSFKLYQQEGIKCEHCGMNKRGKTGGRHGSALIGPAQTSHETG